MRTYARWLGIVPIGRTDTDADSQARRSRLQLRLEGGVVSAKESAQIPSTLLYLTGGDTTVRGYSYRQIGTVRPDGTIVAGRYLGVASVEWQRPVVYKDKLTDWESVVFVDAGAVADKPADRSRPRSAWASVRAGAARSARCRPTSPTAWTRKSCDCTCGSASPSEMAEPTKPDPTTAAALPVSTRPRSRGRRVVRAVLWTLASLLALLLVLGAGSWWWLGSNQSLAFALAKAARYMPAGQTLESRDVTGSLRTGGRIGWLHWQSPTLSVEVRDATIGWQLRSAVPAQAAAR